MVFTCLGGENHNETDLNREIYLQKLQHLFLTQRIKLY